MPRRVSERHLDEFRVFPGANGVAHGVLIERVQHHHDRGAVVVGGAPVFRFLVEKFSVPTVQRPEIER